MNLKSLVIISILSCIATETVARLKTTIYNPGKEGIFPTASTLLIYKNSSIQFDAQFSTKDGAKVAELIQKSGTKLERIVISCGDPDYYFGLQSIKEFHPDVEIFASRKVVNRIRSTMDEKLAYWAPQLGDGTPTKLYVPEKLKRTVIPLGDVDIFLESQDNYAAYYWIPKEKLMVGGVGVSWGIHVFTADTQTPWIRASWQNVLRGMIARDPERVIPGHFLGEIPPRSNAVKFTLRYLEVYEYVLWKNNYKNSTAVIDEMKEFYPHLPKVSSLELGAKVNTGEMKFSR